MSSSSLSVSFFLIDDEDFELFIATGYVSTVQNDKKIQVQLNSTLEGHKEIIEQLSQNNKATIRKIIVKPGTPQNYMN